MRTLHRGIFAIMFVVHRGTLNVTGFNCQYLIGTLCNMNWIGDTAMPSVCALHHFLWSIKSIDVYPYFSIRNSHGNAFIHALQLKLCCYELEVKHWVSRYKGFASAFGALLFGWRDANTHAPILVSVNANDSNLISSRLALLCVAEWKKNSSFLSKRGKEHER